MSKYLIVNADDYGMCASANSAVEELFLNGRLHSSTIMLPCAAAKEAVDFSISHPEFAIGVHLTLTSEWNTYRWKPLSSSKSLIDEQGFMWPSSRLAEKNADIKEAEAEVRAQIERAQELGMSLSHLDNHMGSLYGHQTGRPSLLKMTLRLCGEYGYAFRLYTKTAKNLCPRGVPYPVYSLSAAFTRHWGKKYGVIMPDYLLFPDWGTPGLKSSYEHYRESILKLWSSIPQGVTETFVHPAHESEELKGITGNWRDRVWEYTLMNDPETHKYLKEHSVTMISYRELISMKKNS